MRAFGRHRDLLRARAFRRTDACVLTATDGRSTVVLALKPRCTDLRSIGRITTSPIRTGLPDAPRHLLVHVACSPEDVKDV